MNRRDGQPISNLKPGGVVVGVGQSVEQRRDKSTNVENE